jgi:competence protein ComEA
MKLILTLTMACFATLALAADPETKTPAPPKHAVKLASKMKTPFDGGQVRLNAATHEELVRLPGVGPMVAEAILSYRRDVKGFVDIAELQSVRGIGRKKFLRLAPFVAL